MHIYLVDLNNNFGTMQNHLLHTACLLEKEGIISFTICCPANSPLAQKTQELNLPLLAFTSQNPKGFANIFKLWLNGYHKEHCLIHTFSNQSSLLGWLIFKLRKKKSTILIHTHKNTETISVDKNNRMPIHWTDANKIICDSNHMVQLLANANINPAFIQKIPAGVDRKLLSIAESQPKKRFIFAALSPQEAANSNELIIKAMPFLWHNKELPPWEIRIFGRGLNLEHLVEMAKSTGVDARLAIIGDQTLSEVLPLCDALIVPSHLLTGATRCLGIAWHNELALICPKTSANLELAKDNENALTFNCNEPQHLSYVMEKIMLNPELLEKIVQKGKEMQSIISIDKSVAQCHKLYLECIAKLGWIISQPKTVQNNNKTDAQHPH